MKQIDIIDILINQMKYKLYKSSNKNNVDNIVIICNGITTKCYYKKIYSIIEKLVGNNFVVIWFDYIKSSKLSRFKYSLKDKLILYKFEEKLEIIYSFIKEKYKNCKISIFSSGLGAYITLNSIIDYNLKFNKIVFNTPAINIRDIFKKKLATKDLIDFYKINPKKLNDEKWINITDFYNEIIKKDLFKFKDIKYNIDIIYDKTDKVISLDDIIYFTKNNSNCKLISSINTDEELINSVINSINI